MTESARAEAERADRELRAGGRRGPLHGIPIGVKDLCHTEGFPTEGGSDVLAGFVPDADAAVVTKLREAGAVIVGKTVTHEFAYGQNVPATRNAWDITRYPGGSSAGSGVAVAVGTAFGDRHRHGRLDSRARIGQRRRRSEADVRTHQPARRDRDERIDGHRRAARSHRP